jgi:hypothetical protein
MNARFLWQWLVALLVWLRWIEKPHFITSFVDTHPSVQELDENEFVIVRSGEHTKWACFRCPCGCGDKIALSLVTERRPSWRVFTDWLKRPTVEPSVWQRAGCYSHFWIRKGAVQWCPGTGQPPRATI